MSFLGRDGAGRMDVRIVSRDAPKRLWRHKGTFGPGQIAAAPNCTSVSEHSDRVPFNANNWNPCRVIEVKPGHSPRCPRYPLKADIFGYGNNSIQEVAIRVGD